MENLKFCPKCGASLEAGTKFCGSCGAKLEDFAMAQTASAQNSSGDQPAQYTELPNNQQGGDYIPPAAENSPSPQKPSFNGGAWVKSHSTLLIGCVGAIAVIVIAIIVILNVTKYQKIDAQDLFEIEFEGINTCGTIDGRLNAYESYYYSGSDYTDKISDLLEEYGYDEDLASSSDEENVSPYFSLDSNNLLDAWTKAEDKNEAVAMRKALLKTDKDGEYVLKLTYDKEDSLSNGDVVKCTVEYDKDYLKDNNIKLTNTEFEVEVEGLEDGEQMDFFTDVSVSFSGVNGRGDVSVDTFSAPSCISYDYEYRNDLSNGDTYTITAKYAYGDLNKAGSKFWFKYNDTYYVIDSETASKDYKVEGLTELQELDVFENLEFETSRGTPFLRVSGVNTDNADDLIRSYVSYSIENGDDLDIGDKFTVKAYAYSYLEDEGYKLAGTPDSDGYVTKEFTVDSSFPAYVTTTDGVAAAEAFRSKIEDTIQDRRQDIKGSSYLSGVSFDGRIESITSFEKQDTYVAFNNKTNYDSFGWGESVNTVAELYKVDVKTTDEENSKKSFYVLISINDVLKSGSEYTSSSSINCKYYDSGSDFKENFVNVEGYTVGKCSSSASSSSEENADSTKETESKAEETESKAEKTDSATEETVP